MNNVQYAPVSLEAKALAFRKDAVRLHRGEMVPPTMAIVYPTYSCNMRCLGCISNAENAKPASIDLGVFSKFVDSFAAMGGESLEFSGGGEPTLHNRFGDLLGSISRAGLQFGMITNGTKPEQVAHALDYHGSRYIRVSVYTTNQISFLKEIVRYRDLHNTSCRVAGKILLGISDIPLLEYMVQEILDAGVDFVSIKAKRHCSDDPERLPDEAKQRLHGTLAELRTRWPTRVYGSVHKTTQQGSCWLSPLHTVIDAFGSVWVCCYYQDRVEDLRIGTLSGSGDGGFRSLWFSEMHRDAISRVIIPECDYYDCRFHEYHRILNSELADDQSHLAFI